MTCATGDALNRAARNAAFTAAGLGANTPKWLALVKASGEWKRHLAGCRLCEAAYWKGDRGKQGADAPIVWPANGTGRGPLRDDFTITYATSPGTRPVEWIP